MAKLDETALYTGLYVCAGHYAYPVIRICFILYIHFNKTIFTTKRTKSAEDFKTFILSSCFFVYFVVIMFYFGNFL